MKTWKDSPEIAEHVSQIVNFCFWVESNEGRYGTLHKGCNDVMGQIFEAHADKARHSLLELLRLSPDGTFVIDMRDCSYPIDAGCELAELVHEIEVERKLPKDSVWKQFQWIDADTSADQMEAILGAPANAPTEVEVQQIIAKLRETATTGMNAFAHQLDQVLAP